jgi:hypothetical protein
MSGWNVNCGRPRGNRPGSHPTSLRWNSSTPSHPLLRTLVPHGPAANRPRPGFRTAPIGAGGIVDTPTEPPVRFRPHFAHETLGLSGCGSERRSGASSCWGIE